MFFCFRSSLLILPALFFCLVFTNATTAYAGLSVVRDAETEDMLADFSRPVFLNAGLSPDSVRFVLVQNSDINAFVAGGMNIFIYTGLIEATQTPDELIGVIAHETGHIADGHLVRTTEATRQASLAAILSTLAGVAVAIGSKDGSAGAAAVALGQQVAQRGLLQYSRSQESSADQAALRYLQDANLPAAGMRDFLSRLQDQELLPEDQQSEFVRTHPLTRDRVDTVSAAIDRQALKPPPLSVSHTERFTRVKAKLEGFINPRGTLQKQQNMDEASKAGFSARYARAVALHLTGDWQEALRIVQTLQREDPNNPYLYELEGQILYENGKVFEAISPYKKSVDLSNGNALLRIGYAQALLNTGKASDVSEAVSQLETARQRENRSAMLWRLLATGYGKQGNVGMATYALAEEALLKGDRAFAKEQAQRAQSQLEKGSAGWIRAGDLLKEGEGEKSDKVQ